MIISIGMQFSVTEIAIVFGCDQPCMIAHMLTPCHAGRGFMSVHVDIQ
jgi:hypothetical protein